MQPGWLLDLVGSTDELRQELAGIEEMDTQWNDAQRAEGYAGWQKAVQRNPSTGWTWTRSSSMSVSAQMSPEARPPRCAR